jgi:inosine-uridine nucleoside N-ribohydrolase
VDLLRAQAPGWIDRMEEMGWEQDGCALHDAVAAAYLADETIFRTETTSVEVELANPATRGVTRFSPATENRPVVRVITDLDTAKCRDVIWSHIEQ